LSRPTIFKVIQDGAAKSQDPIIGLVQIELSPPTDAPISPSPVKSPKEPAFLARINRRVGQSLPPTPTGWRIANKPSLPMQNGHRIFSAHMHQGSQSSVLHLREENPISALSVHESNPTVPNTEFEKQLIRQIIQCSQRILKSEGPKPSITAFITTLHFSLSAIIVVFF
jgi:hypothetical protein